MPFVSSLIPFAVMQKRRARQPLNPMLRMAATTHSTAKQRRMRSASVGNQAQRRLTTFSVEGAPLLKMCKDAADTAHRKLAGSNVQAMAQGRR